MFEIVGNEVLKKEEKQTSTQTAIIKKHYDQEFHTKLTTDKTAILADGMDTTTIAATVYNYLNEQQTKWEGEIIFELDGEQQTVSTTNGEASITFNTEVVGEYAIKTVIDNFRNDSVKVVAE